MKTILSILLLLTGITFVTAQTSNLILFSEKGERFYTVLNGIQQNANPETNVKITDLNAPTYKVRIIFENPSYGVLDKTVYFNTPGVEYTYNIKKDNKGNWVLRYLSEAPIAQSPPHVTGQTVIVYTTVPATTTTTTTSGPGTNVNMGVNVNDPNLGINLNMNVNAGDATTTTTTTYSSTTTTGGPVTTTPVVYLPGYTGPIGCPMPVDQSQFMSMKQSISSKSFEDSKLTVAKQIVGSNCLLCSQVKEIMMLFDFESTRLEFAKFAYIYTYDIGNYYQLNDAFEFESSIDELNKYINGH